MLTIKRVREKSSTLKVIVAILVVCFSGLTYGIGRVYSLTITDLHFSDVSVIFTNSTYQSVREKPTGWFEIGQDADIMLSGIDFNNSGGPLLFNHPSGIASDGQRLFLADTFNNRVLVWNTLPAGNVPPDLVLGQKDFTSNDPGSGRDQMNWPFGVATDGTHLVVADVNNGRVIIWNSIPTENGTPADIVLEGGECPWETPPPEGFSERLPGAAWCVWTNGEKLVVSNTWGGSSVLIWNSFPTRDNQPADIVLKGGGDIGTPRHITSDGNCLIVGDHNAKVEGEPQFGSFFWKSFPTSDDQPYDFFMSKGFGWLRGAFLSDGRLMLIGGNKPELRIWNSFPQDKNDEADIVLELESAKLVGQDYEGVAVAGNRIYFSQGNSNRVIGYNSVPTEPEQEPDFVIGSPDLSTNTLETHFFIQNGVPASNGESLFVASDFDRKLYVWKNIPDQSGAYPDIVYTLPAGPWDIALWENTLALAAYDTMYIWKRLPLEGNLPDVILQGIGSEKFLELKGVALDGRYLYLADYGAGKVYVWEGLPDENLNPLPKFTIEVNGPWRLDSDGEYLLVDTIFDQSIKVYRVADLSANSVPIYSIGGFGRVNLPQAATVSHGHLFIADSGFNRVLAWESIEEALSGKWPPDVILGKTNLDDRQPRIGRNSLFSPSGLSFDGSYLWVGEFKFSNRLLRFSVSEEISYDDDEMDGSWAYGGYGHAVRFSPPNMSWTIDKVKIYGQWYGEDSTFTVELWDENKTTLQEIGPYKYSEFFSSNWEWVTIDIPDIKVDSDFYVCFFADTRPEYGVSVGYDANNTSNRSFIAFATHDLEVFEYNWMIRAKGTSDVTAPAISILSPENKTYATTSIPLTFTVNEATSWIGYSLNGQENVTIVENTTLTNLREGIYSLIIYANDTVGNMGFSSIVCFTVNQTQIFPVVLDSMNYMVATRSNSTITDFIFNQTLMQISFNVNGTHGAVGFCNVTIPKSLLTGDPWTITIEGEPPLNFIPSDNATHSFLYFTYMHTSPLHVIIQGTDVIPEFPSITLLATLMMFTIVAAALAQKKTRKHKA